MRPERHPWPDQPLTVVDPRYALARTVLLDALEALAPHRHALTVVGAQAVYLRTGAAGLSTAPYTTDGDLALDPALLGDDPTLEEAMRARGFHLRAGPHGDLAPGTWVTPVDVDGTPYGVSVDLIVPAASLPGGRTRGARLPAHGKRAALRTHGLEAALIDRDTMVLSGLTDDDDRRIDIAVAGVAALLIAKVIKITERVADERRPDRQKDKDAGDVLRLVRTNTPDVMAERLHLLREHPIAGAVTREAVNGLKELFSTPTARGVLMATRFAEAALPRDVVEIQLTTWTRRFLEVADHW